MISRGIWGGAAAVLAACAGMMLSHPARAEVLDFQALECPGTGSVAVGNVVEEDGFRITKREGEAFQFTVFCTQATRYPGSTALYNNTVNGLIKVARIDGGAFDATEIKVVALNGPAVVPVNFLATKTNGDQVRHAIQTDGRGPNGGLETFALPNTFTDLVSLEWTQQSPFHQFDDLVVGAGKNCVYTVKSAKAKGGCDTCPSRGADIDTETPCNETGDCPKKLKTTISCPSGPGTCKVKGKRKACE